MDDLVTVYGFKMWSRRQGRYVVSRFKAPRDVIERYQVVLMESTGEAVHKSDLDHRGRYLRSDLESPDSAWQSSSFDLRNGLDVTEDPPDVPPSLLPARRT